MAGADEHARRPVHHLAHHLAHQPVLSAAVLVALGGRALLPSAGSEPGYGRRVDDLADAVRHVDQVGAPGLPLPRSPEIRGCWVVPDGWRSFPTGPAPTRPAPGGVDRPADPPLSADALLVRS